MDELQNFAQYGWGGAAVLVMVLLLLLFRRRERTEDDAKAKAREHYNAYIAAWEEWQDYMDAGDAPAAAKTMEAIEEMKAKRWNIAPVVAFALLFSSVCGCRTAPAPGPAVETVLLTEHVRIVAPGDTVPDLPAGESRWWLCTPAGMRHLLPADAPVNRMEED